MESCISADDNPDYIGGKSNVCSKLRLGGVHDFESNYFSEAFTNEQCRSSVSYDNKVGS